MNAGSFSVINARRFLDFRVWTDTFVNTHPQQQQPMASITSPSALTASSFGGWAPTPCRRGFACPYLRRRCCFFGHSPEEVAAESKVGRGHPVLSRDVAVTASLDELVVRVARLERVVEQIAGAPVPQTLGERVQNRTPEQILDSSMPQIMENSLPFVPQEHVQNRVPEQAVGVLVPQITEDGLPGVPQERLQNRTLVQTVGVLVPQITEDGLPIVPQERVHNRVAEQIVGVLVPYITEDGLPVVP